MSYSRFFNYDVYLYLHSAGHVECSACILNDDTSVCLYNDDEVLAHINEHKKAEHDMPSQIEQMVLMDKIEYKNVSEI